MTMQEKKTKQNKAMDKIKQKQNNYFKRSWSKMAASAVPYQVSFVTSSNTYGYSQ